MRVMAVILKEVRQVKRDWRVLFLLILMPAMLLLLFGYALNFDVRHVRLGVLDLDRTDASRRFTASLTASEYFDLVRVYSSRGEIGPSLDAGDVAVAVTLPAGFENEIEHGRISTISALIDGSNPQSATIFQGYINAFVQANAMKQVSLQLERRGREGMTLPVVLEPRIWYNPELKSSMFLIPGLIVFILMMTCVISTSLSVVRERERGTIEQLMVSPLSAQEIIIGKMIPYVLISLLSMLLILVIGNWIFDVPIRGSAVLLFFCALLFVLSAVGQGILISSATSSQQVAFQVATLTSMLPALLLSGFIFPIKSMPEVIQMVTLVIPARYFVVILRALILKGAGFEAVWHEVLALGIFSFFMLALATVRLRRAKLA